MSLGSVASGFGKTVQRIGKIPFIFILIAIELFFYVNGPAFFPDWNGSYGALINAYLVMTVAFGLFVFVRKGSSRTRSELGVPLQIGILSFAMAFFVTLIMLTILVEMKFLVVDTGFDKSLFWQTLIIQIAVVATSEELMFRGVILDMFGARKWSGVLITSALFAVWHSYAYQILWYQLDWSQLNWGSVLIVFVFGVILALVARNKASEGKFGGISASVGVHAAWNLTILGALVISSQTAGLILLH